MILSFLFGAWTFFKTPLGRWLLIAVVIGIALAFLYRDIKAKGYAECKADWNASIARLNNRVDDARDRAADPSVPDPFDADPGSRLQGNR